MQTPVSYKIRFAVFDWLSLQVNLHGDVLDWHLLAYEFRYEGKRVPLLGPQGIWKPAIMDKYPLSITTVPESIYQDRISEENTLHYHYRGTDPNHRDNVGLREAMNDRIPLIYFYYEIQIVYFKVNFLYQ